MQSLAQGCVGEIWLPSNTPWEWLSNVIKYTWKPTIHVCKHSCKYMYMHALNKADGLPNRKCDMVHGQLEVCKWLSLYSYRGF